jgi:hypothetical protein
VTTKTEKPANRRASCFLEVQNEKPATRRVLL